MPPSSLIGDFLSDLKAIPATATVSNPYRDPACRHNLRAYLEALVRYPHSGHLLVGEALGYRGGALTGIPFSSPRLLGSHPHPFLEALRPALSISGDTSEATATMIWDYLQNCRALPAFWNIFPFHPHAEGNNRTNRKPQARERDIGEQFLRSLVQILEPKRLIAVGKVAEAALRDWYPGRSMRTVRHPSHGGKQAFMAGLTQAGVY